MRAILKTERFGRFGVTTAEKAGGITYTPEALADFVAREIVEAADNAGLLKKKELRVLDPAVGSGVLLRSLLSELAKHGKQKVTVCGFEPNEQELQQAVAGIRENFPKATCDLQVGDFLEFVLARSTISGQGSLFAGRANPDFDLIIANPPYVRTQVMGAEHAQVLAKAFGLGGRVDLYYAFIFGMGRVLDKNGVAGVIVSNRFMTTKSGASVREGIRREVRLLHVWDLGDTKLFDAAVLPAVLLFRGRAGQPTETTGFTSVYSSDSRGRVSAVVGDPIAAVKQHGLVAVADGRRFLVRQGTLGGNGGASLWRVATAEGDEWLAKVKAKTWGRFGDVGKIRVGIKTCADKVFLRDDWEDFPASEVPELLQPLTTHHSGRRFRAAELARRWRVLYPHLVRDGRRAVADLAESPRSKAYLLKHRDVLEARRYVVDSGRHWYEVWVPQDPTAWPRPKLVFKDIAEKPTFWLDLEGSIVNGDCYWLVAKDGLEDLLWLAVAVGNSSFIEAFYDHRFNNKLYAGRRRFITQYVEEFPLPDPKAEGSKGIIAAAKAIYSAAGSREGERLETKLDAMVWHAFGLEG